jgi:hypothetical protein
VKDCNVELKGVVWSAREKYGMKCGVKGRCVECKGKVWNEKESSVE